MTTTILACCGHSGLKTEHTVCSEKKDDDNNQREKRKRTNPFLSILQKQVKYGDQPQLAAKIAAAVDSRAYFTIARVDKFAAAAPFWRGGGGDACVFKLNKSERVAL
jgi:hypothetical protein